MKYITTTSGSMATIALVIALPPSKLVALDAASVVVDTI
jgi:hypothetical protein